MQEKRGMGEGLSESGEENRIIVLYYDIIDQGDCQLH